MKKILVVLVILSITLFAQQATDRWKGADPHIVPHCDIPARAAKNPENSASCHCLGMVAEVQNYRNNVCWQNHSTFPLPEDEEEAEEVKRMIYRIGNLSEELVECLQAIPSHCRIISYGPAGWGVSGTNTCSTRCKPERCGCKDSVCAAHGETEDY